MRTLSELMAASTEVLAGVLAQALVQLEADGQAVEPSGTMLRLGRRA